MKKMTVAKQHTTCYIIAYDIPDDKRRTKVHKLLLGFGKWTQYSLFECFLTRKELILLRSKLLERLDERQDSVRLYSTCAACLDKVETIGSPPPSEQIAYIV